MTAWWVAFALRILGLVFLDRLRQAELLLEKPKITHLKIPEVKEKQFELFFADKANVNMSSYKVDVKIQLSILYLKD